MKPSNTVRRLYIVFQPDGHPCDGWEKLIEGALYHINHDGAIYLLAEDPLSIWESFLGCLEIVAGFLKEAGFVRMKVRPVHKVQQRSLGELKGMYTVISGLGEGFHREALSHQVSSRWMVLPVLRVGSPGELDEALELASFLRERMILPSFSLSRFPGIKECASKLNASRERIILESREGVLEGLFDNDLMDELLDWALSSTGGVSLHMCSAVIMDLGRNQSRRCPWQEQMVLGEWPEVVEGKGPEDRCFDCWTGLLNRMTEGLDLNKRLEEAGRIFQQLGVFAMLRGDKAQAEELMLQAQDKLFDPVAKGENLLYLGILRLGQGKVEEAHEALTQALSLLPDSASVRYHLGRCEFAWKDFIAASSLFEEALEKGIRGKERDDLLLQLAICHIHLEEFREAREVLEEVEEVKAPVKFYRGMALLGEGKVQQAQAEFVEALESSPEDEDRERILFYVGHCHKELGQFQEACAWLERAVEVDPKSYQAWNLLGYCRFKLGLHYESIQAFLRALELNPKSALDIANIGSNLREIGDVEGAIKWYRWALRMDPTLGFAAQGLKKLEEAQEANLKKP